MGVSALLAAGVLAAAPHGLVANAVSDGVRSPRAEAATVRVLGPGGLVPKGVEQGQSSADPLVAIERRQQDLFDRIAPSVVFISRGDSFGSGFFVAPGQILTNAHVVGKNDRVKVILHDGRTVDGLVLELGKDDLDLALVEVPISEVRPLPLASSSLRIGGWVASVNHGYGGIWTFTTGMVSNIYPSNDRPVFQTQIPLNPGSSGGPVFDHQGRVLGVVTAGIEEAQGINFAIRSDVAFEALPRLAASDPDRLTIHAPAGATVLVNGKMAGKGPRVLVRVSPGTHRIQAVIADRMVERRVVWPEVATVRLE